MRPHYSNLVPEGAQQVRPEVLEQCLEHPLVEIEEAAERDSKFDLMPSMKSATLQL
jgi:hypothetical protein